MVTVTKSTMKSEQSFRKINSVKSIDSDIVAPKNVPHHDIINVTNMDELEAAMNRVSAAQEIFSSFTQAKIDSIIEAACDHFMLQSEALALLAHEETGMGIPAHKHAKNSFAVDYVRKWYRDTKTCGVIERDEVNGLDVVASPMGVIAAVIPTTNPTSTVAFKALCTLKTRNAIVVAPHPRAKKCTYEALRVIIEGAVAAGAPADIAACISTPTLELSGAVMKHPKTALVLATGGPGMVKAAYSSGHPAVGVGPGNVPVVVDSFANLHDVAENVILSKNFDYGVICSSEQVVIAEECVYELLKQEFVNAGAYFLEGESKEKVAQLLFKDGGALNADVVGKSPKTIAEMAAVTVPETTTLLVGEFETMDSPFAREKLSPVLGFTSRKSVDELFAAAVDVLRLGGEGHTACYYTNQHTQESRINRFASKVIVTRCLINQPTAPGGIGGVYNFGMNPSMTLGCGSYGGNYVSDNVGPMHLLNYKRVSRVAEDQLIVMNNIDCLVPPHRAVRCAMEVFILSLVLLAKDGSIVEPYPEMVSVVKECQKFLDGSEGRNLQRIREAILYFTQHSLYEQGHIELNLSHIAQEFNIPGGNVYPILFPVVAPKLEQVEWKNLEKFGIGISTMEQAVQKVRELQEKSGMMMSLVPSTKLRLERCERSTISDVLKR